MVKRVLIYDNEEDKKILSTVSEQIDNIEDIKDLIQDLKDTFHSLGPNAHGLSACQIGINKRVFICSWGGQELLIINPTITRTRGQENFSEGCLSIPGVIKDIPRYQKVWCSYINEDGEEKEIAEGGRMSNIIQHEIDHLNGISRLLD